MINVLCIPYRTFKEKINIYKSYPNCRFTDLGNAVYLEEWDNIRDEPSAYSICKQERRKVRN